MVSLEKSLVPKDSVLTVENKLGGFNSPVPEKGKGKALGEAAVVAVTLDAVLADSNEKGFFLLPNISPSDGLPAEKSEVVCPEAAEDVSPPKILPDGIPGAVKEDEITFASD